MALMSALSEQSNEVAVLITNDQLELVAEGPVPWSVNDAFSELRSRGSGVKT